MFFLAVQKKLSLPTPTSCHCTPAGATDFTAALRIAPPPDVWGHDRPPGYLLAVNRLGFSAAMRRFFAPRAFPGKRPLSQVSSWLWNLLAGSRPAYFLATDFRCVAEAGGTAGAGAFATLLSALVGFVVYCSFC